eukprot:TRINITY_DN10763_c0_g1_i2.p1 TRINITY_DN10763_c0_g1~~TRINITY_DN10763_c0_g1_i2.p1  ORF type:complete len:337 (+),score=37.24 TRINITY_DN10763_c0_g1_i2:67-1011(+)
MRAQLASFWQWGFEVPSLFKVFLLFTVVDRGFHADRVTWYKYNFGFVKSKTSVRSRPVESVRSVFVDMAASVAPLRPQATAGLRRKPAPTPGHRAYQLTPRKLQTQWSSYAEGAADVIGFYGHSAKAGKYQCFSNFYDQKSAPFRFQLPEELSALNLPPEERCFACEFSEKAIMACKAAAMGDQASFDSIKKVKDPASAKRLGQGVKGFDNNLWTEIVCAVAFEVVHQKFLNTRDLQAVLLSTGDSIIAEATRNDKNWGIGIDVGDARVKKPGQWQGSMLLVLSAHGFFCKGSHDVCLQHLEHAWQFQQNAVLG